MLLAIVVPKLPTVAVPRFELICLPEPTKLLTFEEFLVDPYPELSVLFFEKEPIRLLLLTSGLSPL